MRIHIISVAARVPAWVDAGWEEYQRRLVGQVSVALKAIKPAGRTSGDAVKWRSLEWERLHAALPKGALRVALDAGGRSWTSPELARQMDAWRSSHADVALLIGGPDGLDPECLRTANHVWSLSSLTFPHALVRIVLIEQLYRAWSILQGHPYHRV